MASRKAEILNIHESLGHFLAKRFFSLSSYSQRSIARILETQPTTTKRHSPSDSLLSASSTSTFFSLPPPAELDARLPKVCEALVLITQCIVTISLEAEEQTMLFREEGRSPSTNFKNMKEYFNEKKFSDQGIVESLIGLYCFFQRKKKCDELVKLILTFLLIFFFFFLDRLVTAVRPFLTSY